MSSKEPIVGAEFDGFLVPASPYVTETRAKRISKGRYEGPERRAGRHLIRAGDRIVELGAGLGVVGGEFLFRLADTQLWSFEANPKLIEHTQALYDINGVSNRAKLHNEIILTQDNPPESVTFHIYGCFLGSSLIDSPRKSMPTVEVPTRKWDDVCASFSPDILVIDIEGGELEFLRGADLSGLRAIIIEFHPDRYGESGDKECKRIIKDAGFEPVEDVSSRSVWGAVRAA